MGQTRLSLRNRLLLLKEEYRDAVICVSFFCAVALMKTLPGLIRQDSPIIDTQRVSGIVEYATTPMNPNASVGQGLHFTYQIRLQDSGAIVFVDGEVETPHVIGSRVSVERRHHKNGTDTYLLLRG
ncbi:hypothetical protein [Mesorhizobium sp. M7A.F.Ca.MR.245.00.0.0]|uniref:hypothetical protein n=1 Tax=Mesorhizobium sp. M7A.F.Ca.MR.245.00.0.0 TaxID=2496778 RepID=UPI000FCC645E|nr:hypothetical protein [Mesorhizobium sp. M7A.F.Ca.MR.245.00.0.0]RUV20673.1 hypothetical protein EOB80_14435 [Mesorhizobium sp. M7A.F.Ca.MR.245.00.0.0]RUV41301.1 hypothetical protein EOB77_34625 [Mesorhizobium sp. M7A.F.Ca.MR.228.00.0.0]